MQIVVMGATGFVGREVVRQGLALGHEVVALVRVAGEASFDPEDLATGRLTPAPFGADAEVLKAGFGVEPGARVVHVAGLPRERPGLDPLSIHGPLAEEAVALAEGLEASALAALLPLRLEGPDPWSRSQAQAAAILDRAQVPTARLRSAPLFGPGDALLDEIGAWMMRSPVIPRFLEAVRLDPLAVEDAAEALLQAPAGEARLGGRAWTWGALLEACAEAAGKSLLGPRLRPATARAWGARLGHRAFWSDLVPFTAEGFDRHQQGYAVEGTDAARLLGRDPADLRTYLRTRWPYRA